MSEAHIYKERMIECVRLWVEAYKKIIGSKSEELLFTTNFLALDINDQWKADELKKIRTELGGLAVVLKNTSPEELTRKAEKLLIIKHRLEIINEKEKYIENTR